MITILRVMPPKVGIAMGTMTSESYPADVGTGNKAKTVLIAS